jgi:hypothetical protein
VSHISTLEALDVSIDFLLILILVHHLGILSLHWMPCLSTPSCFLLIHHQVTTIFMVDLVLCLGLLFLLNLWLWLRLYLLLHQLLGWAHWGEMTPSAVLEALDMLEPLFLFLQLELFLVRATICKMSHFMAFEAHEMR